MVAESGYISAQAHRTAILATRKTKEYGVDPDHLISKWRDEAAALGFGPEQVDACIGRVNESDQPASPPEAESLHAFLTGA